MKLRGFAVVLAAFAFALVPFAGAMTEAVSANGTIVRNPDGSYILEIEVTGDTVQCMRYTAPPGTAITSASGPGQTGFQGSTFGSQGTNITSGSSKSWRFTTDKPLTPGAHGTLDVSATCAFGSDVRATLEGPIELQCKCLSFTARILPKSISLFGRTDQSLNLGFTIFWLMNCSSGLEGCTGHARAQPAPAGGGARCEAPPGRQGRQARQGYGDVHVRGPMRQAQPGHAGVQALWQEAARREEPCEQDIHAHAGADVPGPEAPSAEVQARLRQARTGEQKKSDLNG